MSNWTATPVRWPIVLRGGLIAVFLYLCLRALAAFVILAFVLFALFSGSGFLQRTWELEWSERTWPGWPIASVIVLMSILLLALEVWLVMKFFRRAQNFSTAFLTVLSIEYLMAIAVQLAVYLSLSGGEFHGIGGGLAISIAIYQYLIVSPRARTVFGPRPQPQNSPITDA